MSVVPAEEIARERVTDYLLRLSELAPTSLAAHSTLFHRTDMGRPIVPARHHMEWIRILEDAKKYRWVVIVAPPGSAKSTFVSMIYPSWRIGATGGKIRIGMVSNTAQLVFDFVRSIEKTIESEWYQKIYKGVEPDPKRGWSRDRFWVKGSRDAANPTLMAAGIGGPLQGKRFDEIILDDPTTWENARSENTMEGQRHWLKALLLKRFPPGMGPPDGKGRMVVICTRWSERDLVPTLQDVGFKVITMPALGYWDREEYEDGSVVYGEDPLWPETESRQQLLAEREEDEIVFELVKQGNPAILSGDVFNSTNFQYGKLPRRDQFKQVVSYVDTAGGKDRDKGDFFAEVTVGLRDDDGVEEVWIMNVERGRISAPDQERAVIRVSEDEGLRPDLVCIEDVGEGIALYQRLVQNTRLPLRAVTPIRDKEFRAIPLANAYRARKVFHPATPTGGGGWEAPRWVRSLEAELAAFPNGAHDDQVDAASGAYANSTNSGPRVRALTSYAPRRHF